MSSIEVVSGGEVVRALENAADARGTDVVMAGGGDGTVSAAAACLMGKTKALAILPAGTMNLFARGLDIPLSLDKAIEAFATGETKAVDMASANGRPFVHQFSIGMHAKMVHLRSKMEFGSRWGKMRASARAAYSTLMNPPTIRVELKFGDVELITRTTGIGVTNNLFGERVLPYADDPAGGTLGIYVTVAQRRGELLRFFAKLARGKWRDNEQVEIHEAQEVRLRIKSKRFQHRCVIDGELMPLERETLLEIHPRSLNVLVPAPARQEAQGDEQNELSKA
jgi:diacylglycerol kinase family enzyme